MSKLLCQTDTKDELCGVCHGPMVWTMVRGERWMACQYDCCDQLDMFGLPSLYAKGQEFTDEHWMEHPSEGRVEPPESSAAKTSGIGKKVLEDPPRAFLESLWEGSDG